MGDEEVKLFAVERNQPSPLAIAKVLQGLVIDELMAFREHGEASDGRPA